MAVAIIVRIPPFGRGLLALGLTPNDMRKILALSRSSHADLLASRASIARHHLAIPIGEPVP